MQMINPVTQRIGILIPALDPDHNLVTLMAQLLATDQFTHRIIVVDDGSSDKRIFQQLETQYHDQLRVIYNTDNHGKGAALKQGFAAFIHDYPEIVGIATMDSDGQHTVPDLLNCIALFAQQPNDMVTGQRTFPKSVPLRSRFGNLLTNALVRGLTGLPITDTQTGLRVIPIAYAKTALTFTGARYAFEFEMLLQAKANHVGIHEQPIQTIYIDNNSASHFRVIRDSLSIYLRFIKFALSGLLSFIVDIGLFALIVHITAAYSLDTVLSATIIARLLSAVVNYTVNHHMVFDHQGHATLIKYIGLMCVQMLISGYATHALSVLVISGHDLTLVTTGVKVIVDFLLFLVSYQVQKRWIFKKESAHHGHEQKA